MDIEYNPTAVIPMDDVPYPTHAKVPGRVSNFDYNTHQWEVVLREEA